MVFPNFFITFVRHSFHTPHPCTSPSRERRHRPAPSCHQAPHFPHGTRAASRAMHTRCTSQKAMLTRHAHATHPRLSQHTHTHTTTLAKGYATRAALPHSTHAPHTTTLAKGYATCAALPHSTHALHATTTAKGYATHTPTRKNAAMLSLAAPSFLRRKSEPPQPKYYILQYYM